MVTFALFLREFYSYSITKFGISIRKLRILSTGKHKYLFFLGIILCTILLSVIASRSVVNALSLNFIQTDWSGSADTVSTIDVNNITGWTKFYSKSDGINISTIGEVKLNVTVTQP